RQWPSRRSPLPPLLDLDEIPDGVPGREVGPEQPHKGTLLRPGAGCVLDDGAGEVGDVRAEQVVVPQGLRRLEQHVVHAGDQRHLLPGRPPLAAHGPSSSKGPRRRSVGSSGDRPASTIASSTCSMVSLSQTLLRSRVTRGRPSSSAYSWPYRASRIR